MRIRARGENRSRSALGPLALVGSLAMLATQCLPRVHDPADPMLHGDWRTLHSRWAIAAAPGVPAICIGFDRLSNTVDDWTVTGVVGDLDIVLRAGTTELSSPIPPSAMVVADPALGGPGNEVDFSIVAVDGQRANPLEEIVASPSFGSNPVIVLGFADLDGDGWIGPTRLDGNALDDEIEESELSPVAMQLAELTGTAAWGRLRLLAAGPPGNPLRIVLTAASYTGATQPDRFGGVVPLGPAVSTAIPYPVPVDPADLLDAGPAGPELPTPDRPLGLELRPSWPTHPSRVDWQAAHALPSDGSRPSVDVVTSVSRDAVRFGLVRSALHPDYRFQSRRPVRPGLAEDGSPHLYEVVDDLGLSDDGPASVDVVRVVALDSLGNIAEPAAPSLVSITVTGGVRILSPDTDGDPTRESVTVTDARGTQIVVGDAGGASDDALHAGLVFDSELGVSLVAVLLPDTDVDDSGSVDEADVEAVESAWGLERGEVGFDPRLDVDGNGRVENDDVRRVEDDLGASVVVP